jgi:hypothetical protein
LPVETKNGDRAYALGLNLEDIVVSLRSAFLPDRDAGVAVLRISKDLEQILPEAKCLIALLRQSLRFEAGAASESGLSMHVYSLGCEGEPTELRPEVRAEVIRILLRSQRVRDWPSDKPDARIDQLGLDLASKLRVPSEDEMVAGIRHCVWPLASVILVR